MTEVAAPEPAALPWYARMWAGLLFLVVAVTGLWWFFHIPPVAHWMVAFTGQDNESGGHYGFWSGFGGSLPDVLLITGLLGAYWALSCKHAGCWLPGWHRTPDGVTRVCRYHHPVIRGRKITRHVLHEMHLDHIGRKGGGSGVLPG